MLELGENSEIEKMGLGVGRTLSVEGVERKQTLVRSRGMASGKQPFAQALLLMPSTGLAFLFSLSPPMLSTSEPALRLASFHHSEYPPTHRLHFFSFLSYAAPKFSQLEIELS